MRRNSGSEWLLDRSGERFLIVTVRPDSARQQHLFALIRNRAIKSSRIVSRSLYLAKVTFSNGDESIGTPSATSRRCVRTSRSAIGISVACCIVTMASTQAATRRDHSPGGARVPESIPGNAFWHSACLFVLSRGTISAECVVRSRSRVSLFPWNSVRSSPGGLPNEPRERCGDTVGLVFRTGAAWVARAEGISHTLDVCSVHVRFLSLKP